MTTDEALAQLTENGLAIYTVNGPGAYAHPPYIAHICVQGSTVKLWTGRGETLAEALIDAIEQFKLPEPEPAPELEIETSVNLSLKELGL